MAPDERLELADEIAVPPEQKVGFEPALKRVDPKLLEPRSLRRCERLRRELRGRRPTPQLERCAKAGGCLLRSTGFETGPSLRNEALEAVQVELVRLELEGISGRARVQQPRRQHLSQLRDVDLHHLLRALRHVLAPQLVNDAIDRQRPVGVDEEERQQRPLFAAAQTQLATAVANLERSEDSKVHKRLAAERTTASGLVYRRITRELPAASRHRVSCVAHLVHRAKGDSNDEDATFK